MKLKVKECTKCGWKGSDDERATKDDGTWTTYICPECSCESFYNTNEELKTRLKTEFMNRFTYEAGDGFRMNTSPTTPEKVFNWISTHVEPLQAGNQTLSQWKKEMLEVWAPVWDYMQNDKSIRLGESISEETLRRLKAYNDLQSENQKLRDLLKDAYETLIISSLIDKSNTCRDSAARIDAFLKTKTNP